MISGRVFAVEKKGLPKEPTILARLNQTYITEGQFRLPLLAGAARGANADTLLRANNQMYFTLW